jgi:GT2 family glycosyltransferase
MAFDPILLDRIHHAEALEKLSLRALTENNPLVALRYADRRCRISPLPKAHHYLLRAEALHQLGEVDESLKDIAHSLMLTPDNLAANRRMLAWGSNEPKAAAARRIIRNDTDFDMIARAITVLTGSGESNFAALRAGDSEITGWAVWSGDDRPELELVNGDKIFVWTIDGVADHQLAAFSKHAASFSFARPRSESPQRATLRLAGQILSELQLRPNATSTVELQSIHSSNTTDNTGKITVIVPVYGDFDATKECLDRLRYGIGDAGDIAQAIVVNDASPDHKITYYINELKSKPGFTILENERNLGFVGSVNRGLAHAPAGDVILLNADTLPPPDFIGRLATAAYSEPNIGTVTPLSNNGEFTSFPLPYHNNRFPDLATMMTIDATALYANRRRLVDLPSGIGFCLYITQACRETVGPLADLVHRGYFEDVDFCLRARDHGFRNVCAPSVYVGHIGSRSFGSEKRELVVRNFGAMELRYPNYRSECVSFILADPLKTNRAAIERHLLKTGSDVLVVGTGACYDVALSRASSLQTDRKSAIILAASFSAYGPLVSVIAPNDDIPQSLQFDLTTRTAIEEFRRYLIELKPARFEIIDPSGVPDLLRGIILEDHTPLDVFIANGGLSCPRGIFLQPNGETCKISSGLRLCIGCTAQSKSIPMSTKHWLAARDRLLAKARAIIAPSNKAEQFARKFLNLERATIDVVTQRGPPIMRQMSDANRKPILGVVPIGQNSLEFDYLRNILYALRRNAPNLDFVVLGNTIDDIGLMAATQVLVSGKFEDQEIGSLLVKYEISSLFIASRQPLFGHPRKDAFADSGLPVASFDWLNDQPKSQFDLSLDVHMNAAPAADALADWVAQLSS